MQLTGWGGGFASPALAGGGRRGGTIPDDNHPLRQAEQCIPAHVQGTLLCFTFSRSCVRLAMAFFGGGLGEFARGVVPTWIWTRRGFGAVVWPGWSDGRRVR